MWDTDRGQGFTLEGVFASLLLVTALLFALQVVSPAAYSGDSPGESDVLRQQAQDVLAAAEDDGTLTRIALCGGQNVSLGADPHPSPYNAIGNGVIDDGLAADERHNATEFGHMLNRTFLTRGYYYTVEFAYLNASSDGREVSQVYPSDGVRAPKDAVVATHRVTLYDDMTTTGINRSDPGHPNKYCDAGADGVRLGSVNTGAHPDDKFYAKDAAPGRELYNVVEIRVIVW